MGRANAQFPPTFGTRPKMSMLLLKPLALRNSLIRADAAAQASKHSTLLAKGMDSRSPRLALAGVGPPTCPEQPIRRQITMPTAAAMSIRIKERSSLRNAIIARTSYSGFSGYTISISRSPLSRATGPAALRSGEILTRWGRIVKEHCSRNSLTLVSLQDLSAS